MKYKTVIPAVFINRPNRFTAEVEIDGRRETVHVKNTGRCRELLVPGAEIYLEKAENSARKTAYDLIAVRKSNGLLVNIDSQAPNAVVREWLEGQNFDRIIPEYTYQNSRIDFFMEKSGEKYLLEVKGCTLEIDGIGYFPDAPTERGAKHLRELQRSIQDGYHPGIAFAIQMEGIREVRPNYSTDPAFGQAFDEAVSAGVKVLFMQCRAEPDGLVIINKSGYSRCN